MSLSAPPYRNEARQVLHSAVSRTGRTVAAIALLAVLAVTVVAARIVIYQQFHGDGHVWHDVIQHLFAF